MGWMKRIKELSDNKEELQAFEQLYLQTLADEESTMLFRGVKITTNQAKGILDIVCDFKA